MKEADQDFDRLVGEFFGVWCRYHPRRMVGTRRSSGLDRLPPVDDDEVGALLSWLETTLVGLEEIPFNQLDRVRRIELQMLFGACQLEYTGLLVRDWRRNDPLAWIGVAEAALSSPAILAALPEFLRGARGHLTEMPELIPRLWLEHAGARAMALIERIREQLVADDDPDDALAAALHAVQEYAAALTESQFAGCRGSAAVGRGYLGRVLRLGFHLGEDLDCFDEVLDARQPRPPEGPRMSKLADARTQALEQSETGIRHYFRCSAMVQAWHLYLEWLGGQDDGRASGRQRLLARVDLDFHLARIDDSEALAQLTRLDPEPGVASSRLLEISRNPGLQLASWAYYRLLQVVTLAHCDSDAGCIAHFHHDLRQLGSIPLPLLRLQSFEDPSHSTDWTQLLHEVCSLSPVS